MLTMWKATAYGACIVADYNAVEKDKCRAEFMKLKDCYLVSDLEVTAMTITNTAAKRAMKKGR